MLAMLVDTAAMSMNIKSEEAHALARELSDMEGTTITAAVTLALKEAIARRHVSRDQDLREIMALAAQVRARLPIGLTSVNAFDDLYDENGLPT